MLKDYFLNAGDTLVVPPGVRVVMESMALAWHPDPGHTRGDTIAWVEEKKELFSGDLVEYEAGVYTGDAQLEEWPATLAAPRALNALANCPQWGEALQGAANVNKAIDHLAPVSVSGLTCGCGNLEPMLKCDIKYSRAAAKRWHQHQHRFETA